ncbi:DUF5658 family protein [Haladaptatus caseinilyticus]|uniref:DUF5658 family protein n=1 Tax=Haladaptatus caseinilyticus TaxID=2993314 RepID=UPI00224A7D30|nr:DUF5658 family protein [Haladaptatus caseinilyticus]
MSYRRRRLPTRLRRAILPGLGTFERLLWVFVFVVLVGDLLTTYVGLNAGLTESNPVARSALSRFGFVALVGLKAFSLTVGVICRRFVPREYVALVPAGLALPWTIAVLVNLSLFVSF